MNMKLPGSMSRYIILCAAALLASCAAPKLTVQPPAVTLTGIEVRNIGISGQTFLLGFAVSNPNPFPLPVKNIRYTVMLDGQRFAGGETESDFVVSARGDGEFRIGVEMDLLQSVSQLSTLFRGGLRDTLEYDMDGSLAVDIPFSRPIPFSSKGVIKVRPYN
ncbi:MAG TPA: LEA type 2 family protein [Woeseiaceae bacterium]|nr:LEA type 2 family protein [Woeseiaceae bacterium]